MLKVSALQKERIKYQPKLPKSLKGFPKLVEGAKTVSVADQKDIEKLFPNTYGMPIISFEEKLDTSGKTPINVGVILSGGQAPGGHNVISGIFDGIKNINPESKLYGFLGGPGGFVDHEYIELTADIIDDYRNTGGFDIIGSGRTKLEEDSQYDKGLEIAKELGLHSLVIIGGDDSNTNACILAEYYAAKNSGLNVIGCPKTIDGDLKNEMIEASFGFDTATKVYSGLIGNIQRDANSAKKYWHFIKLMGRSASHIALECALKTRPNITLISEEVEAKQQTLNEIVEYIAKIVAKRAKNECNFGVALIPEGLIEFIPEMKNLIEELNTLLAHNEKYFNTLHNDDEKFQYVNSKISDKSSHVFNTLPENIQMQLLADRDPHGNVQVSKIETEQLLVNLVSEKLREMEANGDYHGNFSTQTHFLGYEGRCAAPSNFDADYCYSLGITASVLISEGKTGYMASVRNLTAPSEQWIAGGVPITMMMNMEKRHKDMKPVIQKALVELNGAPFSYFKSKRNEWAYDTNYIFPGPIQYFGPTEVCDATTEMLKLEKA